MDETIFELISVEPPKLPTEEKPDGLDGVVIPVFERKNPSNMSFALFVLIVTANELPDKTLFTAGIEPFVSIGVVVLAPLMPKAHILAVVALVPVIVITSDVNFAGEYAHQIAQLLKLLPLYKPWATFHDNPAVSEMPVYVAAALPLAAYIMIISLLFVVDSVTLADGDAVAVPSIDKAI